MLQIAVLISGGGTNLQSLIDSSLENRHKFRICAVIADREASGLHRAEQQGIDYLQIDRNLGMNHLSDTIDAFLRDRAHIIVLAGFLSILNETLINKWKNQIINIHPSLLPKFGGKGMYGLKVHKAVIESGESESGCTVHYVDSGIDTGLILKQKSLKVDKNWNAEQLQKEVLMLEHVLLSETVLSLSDEWSDK